MTGSSRKGASPYRLASTVVVGLLFLLVVVAAAASSTRPTSPRGAQSPTAARITIPPPLKTILAWRASSGKASKHWRIAYVAQAIGPDFIDSSIAAVRQEAKKHGVTVQVFDGKFSPAAQAKALSDAI